MLGRLDRFVRVDGDDIRVNGRLLSIDDIALSAEPGSLAKVQATITATAYTLPAGSTPAAGPRPPLPRGPLRPGPLPPPPRPPRPLPRRPPRALGAQRHEDLRDRRRDRPRREASVAAGPGPRRGTRGAACRADARRGGRPDGARGRAGDAAGAAAPPADASLVRLDTGPAIARERAGRLRNPFAGTLGRADHVPPRRRQRCRRPERCRRRVHRLGLVRRELSAVRGGHRARHRRHVGQHAGAGPGADEHRQHGQRSHRDHQVPVDEHRRRRPRPTRSRCASARPTASAARCATSPA